MEINKLFNLIEQYKQDAYFSGAVSKERILEAQDILNISFPASYKMFIEKYGSGDILGIEIYGIIKDPKIDPPAVPNAVWLTKKLRSDSNMQHKFLVISTTGYGPFYVLDTSEISDNDECPVYLWDLNNQIEKKFNDFPGNWRSKKSTNNAISFFNYTPTQPNMSQHLEDCIDIFSTKSKIN